MIGAAEIIVSAIALSGIALTWFLTRNKFLRRIERMHQELRNMIEHRDLHHRITETHRDDEVGRLESTVNDVFDALDNRDQADDTREKLFHSLAEGVREAIIVMRKKVIYANPRAAAMRGVRQRDLMGKSALELIHPDYRDRAADLFEKSLAGLTVPENVEIKMLNRKGDGIWVEGSTTIIDYEGKPALLFAAFDIARRKQSLELLARDKERATTTLQSISHGIITTDIDGRIDYMNSAAETLLGCDARETKGRELSDVVNLVDETDRKPMQDPVAQCLTQRRRVNLGRQALMLAGGEEYSIEVSVSPIGDGAEMRGTVIMLHDVTELRGIARQAIGC